MISTRHNVNTGDPGLAVKRTVKLAPRLTGNGTLTKANLLVFLNVTGKVVDKILLVHYAVYFKFKPTHKILCTIAHT